jgi:TusA-related sulfurtransferase
MLKLQEALVDLHVNESVMIVVDHSCVTESIKDYYKSSKYHMDVDEVIDGVWEITLTRIL